ncbi:post-segregation antitoxin CcdA [Paramagnetospirillum marisnigri]|uniref:Post-segregation antitoxin CcdA n=1 Tax=Paramagnetospirillum marisnigri TaxID=1285242 RepID=A0A178MPK8_9PROT|nr:type II toxin-antitoxin system CcdA family antitoxin [Paramagnetospirillum marisnigri]OAN50646.1 post-segregation antitoxin CcdA [Paramagnetospirillum marisnigri]
MPLKDDLQFDPDAPRKAANLTLNSSLLDLARRLKINVSRACELGLEMQIREMRAKQWRHDNADAIASFNEHVERNGLPLARYRRF